MAARAAGELAAWARRLSRLVTTWRLFFTRWWTSRKSASFWPSEALSSSSRAPRSVGQVGDRAVRQLGGARDPGQPDGVEPGRDRAGEAPVLPERGGEQDRAARPGPPVADRDAAVVPRLGEPGGGTHVRLGRRVGGGAGDPALRVGDQEGGQAVVARAGLGAAPDA